MRCYHPPFLQVVLVPRTVDKTIPASAISNSIRNQLARVGRTTDGAMAGVAVKRLVLVACLSLAVLLVLALPVAAMFASVVP